MTTERLGVGGMSTQNRTTYKSSPKKRKHRKTNKGKKVRRR